MEELKRQVVKITGELSDCKLSFVREMAIKDSKLVLRK